jgi:hypothetical protein
LYPYGATHRQRANACIHPDHLLYALRCGISDLAGQLGRSQSDKLLFRWLEFEFGGDDRFYAFNPLNKG